MKNGLAQGAIILASKKFVFKKIAAMTGREMFCVERLRCEVFVTEQKITLPELDDTDLSATQVFLLGKGQSDALAVCRVFEKKGKWIVGRVAVRKDARKQHLGSEMLKKVQKYVKEQGGKELYCHAQLTAKSFYDYLGYQTASPIFLEGGLKHVAMIKKLN